MINHLIRCMYFTFHYSLTSKGNFKLCSFSQYHSRVLLLHLSVIIRPKGGRGGGGGEDRYKFVWLLNSAQKDVMLHRHWRCHWVNYDKCTELKPVSHPNPDTYLHQSNCVHAGSLALPFPDLFVLHIAHKYDRFLHVKFNINTLNLSPVCTCLSGRVT